LPLLRGIGTEAMSANLLFLNLLGKSIGRRLGVTQVALRESRRLPTLLRLFKSLVAEPVVPA